MDQGTVNFHYDMLGPAVIGCGYMESTGAKGKVRPGLDRDLACACACAWAPLMFTPDPYMFTPDPLQCLSQG